MPNFLRDWTVLKSIEIKNGIPNSKYYEIKVYTSQTRSIPSRLLGCAKLKQASKS